jgi:AcrR family transcriptional regulator
MAETPVRAEGRTDVQQGDAQQVDARQVGVQQAGTQQADTQQADTQQADTQQADTQAAGAARGADRTRPLRADARRNRERVLETAFDAFATEGLSVSVHEIARRAGVGTGTVSRHFPTKEALFEAVFVSRVERLVAVARQLSEAEDAGAAFFSFFAAIVAEGAANRGLADALAGAGFDIKTATSEPEHDVMGALGGLLCRAGDPRRSRRPGSGTVGWCRSPPGQMGYRVGSVVYWRPDGAVRRKVPGVICSTFQPGCCLSRWS